MFLLLLRIESSSGIFLDYVMIFFGVFGLCYDVGFWSGTSSTKSAMLRHHVFMAFDGHHIGTRTRL